VIGTCSPRWRRWSTTSGIIAGGLIGGASFGAEGFAWGVLAGSALGPFLLPWIGCRGMGMRWSFGLDLAHPDLRAYLARSLPIMLGLSIVVVDDWYLRREGSRLGGGAVSMLTYAKNLMKVPMGIFGLAAGVAAYPTLVRLAAARELRELRDTLLRTLRHLLLLALVAQVVLMVASQPLVVAVYGRRAIEPGQVREIALCLVVFALGLAAWSVHSVLARGFYALGNTWLPAILGTVVAVAALPFYMWAGTTRPHWLALVSSLAILSYVIVLAWRLKRLLPELAHDELIDLRHFAARAAVALAVGWAAGTVISLILPDPTTLVGALFQLTLLALASMSAFALAGDRLGLSEVRACAAALRELLPGPVALARAGALRRIAHHLLGDLAHREHALASAASRTRRTRRSRTARPSGRAPWTPTIRRCRA
jgi:putative peptidoglycan lipid II flippase